MRLRVSVALMGLAGCALHLQAQSGNRDRYFARYPFDRWQANGNISQLRWSAQVTPAKLSPHQRMTVRIEIEVSAHETAKRRGRGELATLLQIEDTSGQRWRAHNVFDLTQIPNDAKPQPLTHYRDVFLLPGDYTVSIAVCDSATSEYSFVRRPIRVPHLRGDTLADSWSDLPAVEFIRPLDGPDGWFQPNIRGRLHLSLATRLPVHVDVMMNMTPSERSSGSLNTFRRNMSILVPALKVLAALEIQQGSLDVTLLDLARQLTWEQKDARGLDWIKMRVPLADNQPGVIDAPSLAAQTRMVRFFRDQVLQRACAGEGGNELRVVIVLSAPAFLGHQLNPEPITFERDPNRKIFYLRYRPLPPRPDQNLQMADNALHPVASSLPSDNLENALKPLDGRILTAGTPEEFRKALSAILAAVQRM